MSEKIIKANDILKKGSFTYAFCEEDNFDKIKFLELIDAIRDLALSSKNDKKVSKKLAREIFFIYTTHLISFKKYSTVKSYGLHNRSNRGRI